MVAFATSQPLAVPHDIVLAIATVMHCEGLTEGERQEGLALAIIAIVRMNSAAFGDTSKAKAYRSGWEECQRHATYPIPDYSAVYMLNVLLSTAM